MDRTRRSWTNAGGVRSAGLQVRARSAADVLRGLNSTAGIEHAYIVGLLIQFGLDGKFSSRTRHRLDAVKHKVHQNKAALTFSSRFIYHNSVDDKSAKTVNVARVVFLPIEPGSRSTRELGRRVRGGAPLVALLLKTARSDQPRREPDT
jgi:hypothetical protein